MTLKMTTAQVVETSVTVTNSSFQNYTHPDDHTTRTTDTPGFKPFTIDEYGRVKVKLIREGGKYHLLFNSDGEVNEKIPKTIKDALGTPAEDIIRTKEEEISRREKKIDELQASRETASENQREQIDANIEEQ